MTDIIRGEDHTSNTATQIQLFEALAEQNGMTDFQMPRFAHMPLVSGADGSKLSKSNGALSIRDLREEGGLEPLTIVAFLSRLGTPDGPQPVSDISELASSFSIERFGRSGPRMDPEELEPLNGKVVRQLPYEAVADRFAGMTQAQWAAIQPNLEKLNDVTDWLALIHGPVAPEIEDSAFAAKAAELLPEGELDSDSWKTWTDAVKEATGAKGKGLFMPLRLALTGQPRGPEMAVLLPLIDRTKILSRLNGQAA
jgi:glutamyl-tRNA synthetase